MHEKTQDNKGGGRVCVRSPWLIACDANMELCQFCEGEWCIEAAAVVQTPQSRSRSSRKTANCRSVKQQDSYENMGVSVVDPRSDNDFGSAEANAECAKLGKKEKQFSVRQEEDSRHCGVVRQRNQDNQRLRSKKSR